MQRGFATIEIIFAVLIISLLMTLTLPKVSRVIDGAALDYEIKRLYSELRFLQSINRSETFSTIGTANSFFNEPSYLQITPKTQSYQILRNKKPLRETHFMRNIKSITYTADIPLNRINFDDTGQAVNTLNNALSTTLILTSRLGKQSKIVFDSVGRFRGGRDDE